MTTGDLARSRRRMAVATQLPNVLTYLRIAAVPALVSCFFLVRGDLSYWLAVGIFVAAAITDFFDGYLARAWKQQSSLGRMLDPIADKLLVATSLLLMVERGIIGDWSTWAAVVILCREILVSGLREFLAELQVSVPVTQLAKWKTTLQLIAIGILLSGPAGDKLVSGMQTMGLACLWVSAIVTLYTGYDYFRAGVHHLIDED